MPNSYFQFKQFTIHQDRCAMKVTTDACLFGSLTPTIPASGDKFFSEGGVTKVLDIGTGTGLLALMYAQKNSNAFIDAIEIDKDASDQASENVAASPWKERIAVINSDARTYNFTKKYDLIVSNPPFYENELKSLKKEKNIAHHSEELSLAELFEIIKNNLDPAGHFFLLLPYKRLVESTFLCVRNHLEINYATMVRQSPKHDISRTILRGKHQDNISNDYFKTEFVIQDENQEYTPEFVDLLKDFYLAL